MEHEHQRCPNTTLIKKLEDEVYVLRTQVTEIDKSNAVTVALIKEQYRNIMTIITKIDSNYQTMNNALAELYRKFEVNDYKTNTTTNFVDRLTWGVIGKIGALITVVAVLIKAFMDSR
jgi:translation initiation factor 1 (eIF-1/SUI1)